MRNLIRAAVAAAGIAAVALVAAPAGAAVRAHVTVRPMTAVPVTATTTITNRPDSGVQGNNWAMDNFTRVAKIQLIGQVSQTLCPGTDTGNCYAWKGSITDTGTATTIAGQDAPRAGTLDQSLTATMTGGSTDIEFYSSWKTAKGNPRVPSTLDGSGTVRQSTGNWVEQFFGSSAVFNSAASPGSPDLGVKAGWTYTLGFGANAACPHEAYQWTDAAATGWGAQPADGNILTDSAANCGTLG